MYSNTYSKKIYAKKKLRTPSAREDLYFKESFSSSLAVLVHGKHYIAL